MRAADLPPGKGEGMAACFVDEPKIAAGLLPFRTVWSDPASADSMVRQQMRQLVAKRAFDLCIPKRGESRIEYDERLCRVSHPGRAAHPRIPPDDDSLGQRCIRRIHLHQEFASEPFPHQ